MRDNNILDQFVAADKPIDTKSVQNLYRLFFCSFGFFYGFLLFGVYRYRSVAFQEMLGFEDRDMFKIFVYILLAVAVISFIAGSFYRLRYEYFLPLGSFAENSRAVARYFTIAFGIAVVSWLVFHSVSAERVGEAIGFKKGASNHEFGYFMLFLCFAVAFLYTLLAGLRLVRVGKILQKEG